MEAPSLSLVINRSVAEWRDLRFLSTFLEMFLPAFDAGVGPW
jgi:hypothetical protein